MRKRRRQDRWALTERDAKLVELVLKGYSITEIAQLSGLSRSTVFRRLKSAKFEGLLDEARKEIFRQTGYKVVSAVSEATEYLRAVVSGAESADALRIRAAQALLHTMTQAFQSLALEDVRRDIEQLKALYGSVKDTTPVQPVAEIKVLTEDYGRENAPQIEQD